MPASDGRARPRTLTGRLLLRRAVAVLGLLLVVTILLDLVLEQSFADQATVRVTLAVGFGLAALTGLLALAFVARTVERNADQVRHDMEDRIEAVRRDQGTRETILSALGEGVVLFDAQGAVLYRNKPAEELLGPGLEDAGKLLPMELRRLVERGGREGASHTEVITDRDRTLQATTVPVSGEGQVLLVLRDITHDRRVEAVRREFVSNASHELKTPVASIRALAETIAASMPNDPGATERFVAQLENEAVRLSRIVSDLLDLSRLEAETGERVPIRLDDIVAEEVRRFEEPAREAALSLSVTRLEPAEVRGAAADLALLVRNLVANATQYTRPGGQVEVALDVEGDWAVLTVRDTGIGIPSRDQDRIFERFYRVDRARSRETGGTGLGLSIVKHVAENHGGTVHVQSELGRGSTFVVRIPVVSDREPEGILPRP